MKKEIKNKSFLYYLFFIFLAFIGGFLELYSYLTFSFYTFMHTGNIVLLITYSINNDFLEVLASLISLIAFILGFMLSVYLKIVFKRKKKDFRLFSLITILILLLILIILPTSYLENDLFYLTSTIILTLFGVTLLNGFITFNSINFVPTMMSNNLRQSATFFIEGIVNKDKESIKKMSLYITIIFFFIIGGIISALLNKYLISLDFIRLDKYHDYSLNIALLFPTILIVLSLFIYHYKKEELVD